MRFRLISLMAVLTFLMAVMMSCESGMREDGSQDLHVFGRFDEQGMAIPSQIEVLEETGRTVVLCHKPSGVVYLATQSSNGGVIVMVDAEGKPLTREYFMKSKSNSIFEESSLW